jgi:hypothetical protein
MGEENLYHYRDTLLFDGFLVCVRIGHEERAKRWIGEARKYSKITMADDDDRNKQIKIWEQHPERHHRWPKAVATFVPGGPV